MNTPYITGTTPLSSTSFTVNWTITDPSHSYIITWINLDNDVMNSTSAPENTNSYTVTGLDGINNYNVTVTSNYSEGTMMSTSDPVTVYGKNLLPHLIYTKCTYPYYECTYLFMCMLRTRNST